MGSRTPAATIVGILQAFLSNRTWTQAELARQVGVGVEQLRKRLDELSAAGMPLHAEHEHPHVYWSVPKHWFPGGVMLPSEDAQLLVRYLGRLPPTAQRDRLLKLVLRGARGAAPSNPPPPVVIPPEGDTTIDNHLSLIEDAAASRVTLRLLYHTASSGLRDWRHASAARVLVGPPARLIAWCHRSRKLKTFRVDNISRAEMDRSVEFHAVPAADVESMLATSVGGFHRGEVVEHAFTVSHPDAGWVVNNLPAKMTVEPIASGVRVSTTNAALIVLARFVVSLGGIAVAESDELRSTVRDLARSALAANS